MKTQRSLGLLWLAFSGFFSLSIPWQVWRGFAEGARPTVELLALVPILGLFLFGIAASVGLLLNANWARTALTWLAALVLVLAVAQLGFLKFSWFACGTAVFAGVSLAYLR